MRCSRRLISAGIRKCIEMDNEQKRKEALKSVIEDLIAHKHEEEWFELKVNWNEHRALGEYISAMASII